MTARLRSSPRTLSRNCPSRRGACFVKAASVVLIISVPIPAKVTYLLITTSKEGCWTEEFKAYLLQGTLPEKEEDAERVARQATAYCIQDGELYRKRPNYVSLRCISREQGHELLADIHGGDCGHHSSSRTLVGKAFCSGFYWPTALNDAIELVRSCEACQFHAKLIH
nr:uncharacterized protein LOC123497587 [Aegilops tauschii subsp. strangulata]